MSDDLAKLLPERELTLGSGEVLTLKPLFFGQLPKAVKLLRPVTDAVAQSGIARVNGKSFSLAEDWALRLPELMDAAGDGLLAFVAFAVNKPREFFDTLPADDGIALTKAVFEVNGDFFVKRIAPHLGLAVTPTVETGASSLPDSSVPATVGETSSPTP